MNDSLGDFWLKSLKLLKEKWLKLHESKGCVNILNLKRHFLAS